ncbi:unnamed protein product [Prunus armeniaca]
MAGRLTLLQSVTSAIPIYSMQSAKLPVSICQKLDQLNRNFLWGHTTDQAKRLLQREQGLWAQVFNAKYLRHYDILAAKDLQFQSSCNVWKGILYGAQVLSVGVKWRVGSGDDILLWTDRWLSCGPLQQFALIDLFEDILHLNVSDFLEDGVWDFNCLMECLPINIVNLILSIHAGYNGSGEDKCIWQATSNGQFYVKTAYSTFYLDEGSVNWKWDFIGKLHVPLKVKTFLWLLCHKKLLTNAQRLKRKLTNADVCPRCDCPLESCAHLFMDCAATLAIWNRLGFGRVEAGQDDFDDWLLHNLKSKRLVTHGLPWHLVFAIFHWFIWKWRFCFGVAILSERNVAHLYWMAPLPGGCKVNTDGSRINSSSLIGVGGLLRDSCGNWIKGFFVNLGHGSIIEAELWGIFYGLKMAWDAGFRIVEIECDATSTVALLKSPILSTHPLFSIINCCKKKIHEDWCCSVKHIFREQNCAADALAVKSYDFDPSLYVFLEAPAFLSEILAADVQGVARPRLVSY